jgi:hypothetical protein
VWRAYSTELLYFFQWQLKIKAKSGSNPVRVSSMICANKIADMSEVLSTSWFGTNQKKMAKNERSRIKVVAFKIFTMPNPK